MYFSLLKSYLQGYKVYYTTNPNLALSQWESQFVDNNKLTTVSDLIPHTIYTIRVEAYTAIGPGLPSPPVQVCSQIHFLLFGNCSVFCYVNSSVLHLIELLWCVITFSLIPPWFWL